MQIAVNVGSYAADEMRSFDRAADSHIGQLHAAGRAHHQAVAVSHHGGKVRRGKVPDVR